ncbi:NAD(P)H-dependent flavin oxidoreductase [Paraglaciecola arctica]|uniref:2-nitropropane dioxygenase, NPD n=1 Tax=Paraglaciecola arctica BSs20135 TaxID=493475 RepID=K6YJK7_9ALTE|nr:nitronate monooxygenase [Paraglaciecola arctica]GAC18342.1 2-nitropropane dioxygenase, NPD [Paraglaciecola arctica BSs20135]
MAIPALFKNKLSLPVICAPMFLVSTPTLVISACKNGIVGSFPTFNARTQDVLDSWITEISTELETFAKLNPDKPTAPFAVNLVVHPSNTRLHNDRAVVKKHQVLFVITSQGNPAEVVEEVHQWGGIVFHDVIRAEHAKKAIEAGVDGIIIVTAGAGGHAGEINPFALVREIREFWDGPLALAGAINDGYGVRAAEILGADFSYMGTRFIATEEAEVEADYKSMLVTSEIKDLVYTDTFTGVKCNFLKPSIARAGVDLKSYQAKTLVDLDLGESNAWKDFWSAGHGVSGIKDVLPMTELVQQLKNQYQEAVHKPAFSNNGS